MALVTETCSSFIDCPSGDVQHQWEPSEASHSAISASHYYESGAVPWDSDGYSIASKSASQEDACEWAPASKTMSSVSSRTCISQQSSCTFDSPSVELPLTACTMWACPIDANLDPSCRLEQCPFCAHAVNPSSLFACPQCRKSACILCHLKHLAEQAYANVDAALEAGAGCIFCRAPYSSDQLNQLDLIHAVHIYELGFRLWNGVNYGRPSATASNNALTFADLASISFLSVSMDDCISQQDTPREPRGTFSGMLAQAEAYAIAQEKLVERKDDDADCVQLGMRSVVTVGMGQQMVMSDDLCTELEQQASQLTKRLVIPQLVGKIKQRWDYVCQLMQQPSFMWATTPPAATPLASTIRSTTPTNPSTQPSITYPSSPSTTT